MRSGVELFGEYKGAERMCEYARCDVSKSRGGGQRPLSDPLRSSFERGGKKWAKLGREKAHVENVLLIDHDNDERRRGEDGTLTEQREKKMARCLLRTKALFRCSGSSHL